MRLVSFEDSSDSPFPPWTAWHPGLLTPSQDAVVDLRRTLALWRPTAGLEPPADPLSWYDMDAPWWSALERLDEAVRTDPTLLPHLRTEGFLKELHGCRLGGPVPRPGKILCIGLNYRDHAAEARLPVPDTPVIFAKFPSAVIGPETPIILPHGSRRVDYEAELAVVIGRRAKGVPAERALEFVLGYMNANDVSERDFQKRDGQWVHAKSCDTFAPLGPWIVTADEVPNPNALTIRCRVNGTTLQESRTNEFVFDVARLIAYVTESITLEPGDVLLTGTPPGVGFARQPPVFLSRGDVVEVEIEHLGVLRNPVL